ncbi:hypothetical protein B7486_61105, partial [cyanobacterium TDX16]
MTAACAGWVGAPGAMPWEEWGDGCWRMTPVRGSGASSAAGPGTRGVRLAKARYLEVGADLATAVPPEGVEVPSAVS